jgi:hypothetical protein
VQRPGRALVICMLCLSSAAQAQAFKCTGPDGKTAYQDRPCASAKDKENVIATPLNKTQKDERDPVLASITVASTAYTLERMEEWCARRAPSSVAALKQARARWHERHESLISKGGAIVRSKLSQAERASLAAQSKLETDKIIASIEGAGSEYHRKWCADMPAKMTSLQMDLMARPTLVKTITSYKLP